MTREKFGMKRRRKYPASPLNYRICLTVAGVAAFVKTSTFLRLAPTGPSDMILSRYLNRAFKVCLH